MPKARDVYRRLALLGAALVALLVVGTVAYSLVEGIGLWTAFVWAIDTVATTGADPPPTDSADGPPAVATRSTAGTG